MMLLCVIGVKSDDLIWVQCLGIQWKSNTMISQLLNKRKITVFHSIFIFFVILIMLSTPAEAQRYDGVNTSVNWFGEFTAHATIGELADKTHSAGYEHPKRMNHLVH